MCGITGFLDFAGGMDEGLLRRMVTTLRHRGPDDKGVFVHRGEEGAVGLAHARLSILDLSEAGHQPMLYGDLSIVFNGEIYNFRELRAELEKCGHSFRTASDTEVILHAFSEWGIDCVQRFIGMFAFCLHDAESKRLYLVRDRAGVKPLFVYRSRNFWLFASELKAFHACPQFSARINPNEVAAYFDHGYVPDGRCIFEGCEKVDAGEYWEIELETNVAHKHRYWSVYDCYKAPKLEICYSDAVAELDRLLRSACDYRMIADVPVGVCLSGGYDSTAVAAVLQAGHSSKISTFTIGFTEGNDEAPYARDTAQYLGTDHHELYCSEKEAQQLIPELPSVFDEPFADSSAIPTMLVSRMARQHVKVALSADSGDEVFGGYRSYRKLHDWMNAIGRIPKAIRPIIRSAGKVVATTIPQSRSGLSHRIRGFSEALAPTDVRTALSLHISARQLPSYHRNRVLVEGAPMQIDVAEVANKVEIDSIEHAMALDYSTYLKDDILVKVDRASMSVGLEGREPLVDHRILEFAARLPLEFKFDGNISKKILRDVVHQYVPREMLERPKAGFSLPIYSWLRGELSGLLDEFCSPALLKSSGLLNEPYLTKQISQFRNGRLHYVPLIWRLLMFQMWYQRWIAAR